MNKKAYVYISFICVFSLVFSCFTAGASSVTASWSLGYPNASATYLSSYTVEYDLDSTDNPYPHGDYCVATYEINMPVFVTPSGNDSYLNGYATAGITFVQTAPSGWTYRSSEISYQSYYTENISNFCSAGSSSSSSTYCVVRCIFDNFYCRNITIGLGQVTARFTYSYPVTPNNLPDVPARVQCSTSIAAGLTSLNGTADPQEQGACAVITQAIINGLNDVDGPFNDMLSYIQTTNSILSDVYNHNEQWYSAIVDELLANNQWNSTITDELIALYNELSINTNATINIATYTADLRSFMQTFPTWSAQVLTLLSRLADMNATQQTEAAAIASQYDSLQQQQDNANAVIEGVARPTFSQGQFSGNNLVPQGQRGTFTGFLALITSNNYITTILLIIMTFATAGFVLFGKKK